MIVGAMVQRVITVDTLTVEITIILVLHSLAQFIILHVFISQLMSLPFKCSASSSVSDFCLVTNRHGNVDGRTC